MFSNVNLERGGQIRLSHDASLHYQPAAVQSSLCVSNGSVDLGGLSPAGWRRWVGADVRREEVQQGDDRVGLCRS